MSKESVLLQPLKVGKMILKNRIMFPPLTTGYEERDGSIGPRSFEFYKRLAKGGAAYVVIGDVAPVNTASPTPKLYDERQIPTFKKLADALHDYDCKLALQLFHPEYDVPGVGKMIMQARQAGMLAQKAKQEGNMELFAQKMEESQRVTKEAYAKLHHDMKFFVSECSHEQLNEIKEAIARSAKMAQLAGVDAIEVHGDRLLGSLCSTILNHRKDEYGGSLENRTRYALEVVQAIKEAAPDLTIESRWIVSWKRWFTGRRSLYFCTNVGKSRCGNDSGSPGKSYWKYGRYNTSYGFCTIQLDFTSGKKSKTAGIHSGCDCRSCGIC